MHRLDFAIALIWFANLALILAILGGITFIWTRDSAIEDIPIPLTFTPYQITRTPTSNPTFTITPSTTPRQTPTHSSTPLPIPTLTSSPQWTDYKSIFGYSIENRPIEVFRYGSGPVNKLIIAGIHGGGEYNTVLLAYQLIGYLDEHPETIPEHISLYILPNLNPDGYKRAKGLKGRVNANGVDLNRNFPYNWKSNWNRNGCWVATPVTAGKFGGSEPETQAVMLLIASLRPQALISYHSAALGVFAGGRPEFPPSMHLAQTLAKAGSYQYPPIDTGCDYTGNLTDWSASVLQIPSVDIELNNHRDTDFKQNLQVLKSFGCISNELKGKPSRRFA